MLNISLVPSSIAASMLGTTESLIDEHTLRDNAQWPLSYWDFHVQLRAAIYTALAVCIGFLVFNSGRRSRKLPPGPPTVPIFGNMLQLSSYIRLVDWTWFQDLRETFGPIMSIKLGNKTAIILQDDGTAMRELFEKRGSIYNARPKNSVAEFMGGHDHPLYEQDQQKIRLNRKLIIQHFSSEKCRKQHVLVQEAETTQLLADFLEGSEEYSDKLLRFTVSVLLSVAYGYRTSTTNHLGVIGMSNVMSRWLEQYRWDLTPPLDIWPWLSKLPGWVSPWRKRWIKVRKYVQQVYGGLADRSYELYSQGQIEGSFAHKLFSERETYHLSDNLIQMLLGVVMEGGSDILGFSIETALLAMLAHPDVREKAQEEVDALCDEDTLPTWSHYKTMPYIRSIGKESMRWRPLFPLGVPRRVVADDNFQGYHIPARSMVASSIWVIHQNPDRYPSPEKFMPERFLNHSLMTGEYLGSPNHLDRDHYGFGMGRRSCPGVYLAEQAQFLCIAKILWAYNIKLKPGAKLSDIDTNFTTGFVGAALRRPKKFPLVLEPRSERRVQTIKRELAALQDGFFKKYSGGDGLPIPVYGE